MSNINLPDQQTVADSVAEYQELLNIQAQEYPGPNIAGINVPQQSGTNYVWGMGRTIYGTKPKL